MKTLYLLEMGMNDATINTDIKNHRIRTVENIDIIYKGKKYNMFFEFTHCEHWNYRKTNKRTGAPLKNPVKEIITKDGLHVETEFEVLEKVFADGTPFYSSYRKCDLELEIWNKHYEYTKKNILEIVNKYAIEKYDKVVLIETEAKRIINNIGGFREKDMIKNRDFRTDGGFYMNIAEWTPEHKIITVNRQEWEQVDTKTRRLIVTNTCDVDIETKRITG
jgi:hypothetical protein